MSSLIAASPFFAHIINGWLFLGLLERASLIMTMQIIYIVINNARACFHNWLIIWEIRYNMHIIENMEEKKCIFKSEISDIQLGRHANAPIFEKPKVNCTRISSDRTGSLLLYRTEWQFHTAARQCFHSIPQIRHNKRYRIKVILRKYTV